MTQSKLRFLSISLVVLLVITSAGLVFGAWYLKQLENTVTEKFEGRKWVFPSKIYSDSYLLYVGAPLRSENLIEKLRRLGYYATSGELRAKGEYRILRSGTIEIFLHDFAFPTEQFKGVPVLVNLWASWCAPCIKELPTLDKLAASHREDGQLGVIAVSQDTGPQPSVEAFLKKLKVEDLGAYHDTKMALSGALGPDTVLPTSILYDAQGREVWRYVGDLDWTGAEAAKLLAEAGAAAGGQKPR